MSVPQSFTTKDLKLFIFTQNWSSPHPNFFPEAWSLSIEEWYYVLIPSALFLFVKVLRISPKQSIVYVACAVIFAVTLVRYFRFASGQYSTYDDWDTVFRKQVITRLDSLMFGMLGAFCSYYYPRLWRSHKKSLLAVGVLLLVVARYFPEIVRAANTGLYNSVLSFTVLSVGILLCLPFLSDYTEKGSLLYTPITYISMCSYSMYLLNFTPVAHLAIGVLKRFAGINTLTVLYPGYWVIVMGSSLLMYKYFEKPTTELRSKFFTKTAPVQPVVQAHLSRTARREAEVPGRPLRACVTIFDPRMKPDITYSVITACWNSARTIARCVGSVLGQTVQPREYLFVDGGSTDNTRELIRQSFADHSGPPGAFAWKLLEQGDVRGISAAWNVAIKECTSDIVFILNSDDWYEPDCAERVLCALRDNPDADVVLANARTYRRGESVPCSVWRNRPDWLLPVLMPYVHTGCFVRRSVYERLGGFDPALALAMDYDFLWRCRVSGMKFVRLPDVVSNFELGGVANSHRKEARLETYRIASRYCRVLPVAALACRYLAGR
jgi:GT2 family glycosyltransferase/peptidoglycan/LPS O-acetylase OafA/YrhL